MTAQDLIAAVRRSAKRSGLYDSYDSDSCDSDITAAVHTYAVLNYNGRVSGLYKVLSTSEFNPDPTWTSDQEISTNVFYDTVERIAKRRKLS